MKETYQRLFTAGEYVPDVSTDENDNLLLIYTKWTKRLSITLQDWDLKEQDIYDTIKEYVKQWGGINNVICVCK